MNIRSFVPGKDALFDLLLKSKKQPLEKLSVSEREDYCARKIQVC